MIMAINNEATHKAIHKARSDGQESLFCLAEAEPGRWGFSGGRILD